LTMVNFPPPPAPCQFLLSSISIAFFFPSNRGNSRVSQWDDRSGHVRIVGFFPTPELSSFPEGTTFFFAPRLTSPSLAGHNRKLISLPFQSVFSLWPAFFFPFLFSHHSDYRFLVLSAASPSSEEPCMVLFLTTLNDGFTPRSFLFCVITDCVGFPVRWSLLPPQM